MTRLTTLFLALLVIAGNTTAALDVSAPQTVPHYGLFEVNITHPSSGYADPFGDVAVTAELTSPGGTQFAIEGFYDTTNTWSVRFCPAEMGDYSWKVRLAGTTTDSTEGVFESVASSERGFIRQHPTNPFRLVYEKTGGSFNGMGFGTCFKPTMQGIIDHNTVPFDVYVANMIDSTGFQMVRVSISNCAPAIWETIGPLGNEYLMHEARIYDAKIKMLRAHGARIFMDPLGWMLRTVYPTDPDNTDPLKRYWRYVVARYGALVDFWELCNEASPPDSWITEFAQYVKSIDPYGHMVSVSWDRADIADIDINAPHAYLEKTPGAADGDMAHRIKKLRPAGKPIIYGEIGNTSCSEITDNALQASSRSWGALFFEASLLWWEQNGGLYCPNGAANLYIGPEERRRFRCVQTFAEGMDPGVRPDSTATTSWTASRVMELRSDSSLYLYVHCYTTWTDTITHVSVTANIPAAGTGYWVSTMSGDTVDQVTLSAGTQTFQVPPFVLDAAFKLETHSATTVRPAMAPSSSLPGPSDWCLFDLRGRRVSPGVHAAGAAVHVRVAERGHRTTALMAAMR